MTLILALFAVLAAPAAATPLSAPAQVQVQVQDIDPARLAAAKRTFEALMPPAQRATMFEAMLSPMMANIQQTILSRPAIRDALATDPRGKAILDRFVADQQRQVVQLLKDELPGMFAVMERAYAKRFTVVQPDEITAFFATPTGRLYMDESMKIMGNPEMLAWQAGMMERSLANTESDMKKLQAELEAAAK